MERTFNTRQPFAKFLRRHRPNPLLQQRPQQKEVVKPRQSIAPDLAYVFPIEAEDFDGGRAFAAAIDRKDILFAKTEVLRGILRYRINQERAFLADIVGMRARAATFVRQRIRPAVL